MNRLEYATNLLNKLIEEGRGDEIAKGMKLRLRNEIKQLMEENNERRDQTPKFRTAGEIIHHAWGIVREAWNNKKRMYRTVFEVLKQNAPKTKETHR